jgi:anaerobic magnesium-protoporphyrin IX monomethyl ester cyclase
MIVFVNPRATRPKNRRFPLSVMAIGAALPPGIEWEIVDGNIPRSDPFVEVSAIIDARAGGADPVTIVAFTVMPGPQLLNAVPLTQAIKARYPDVTTVWGGNFPSLYPAPVLNASYIDWAVRGQGEDTFVELLDVIAGHRDPKTVSGLCFRESDGTHWLGEERKWKGPDELPAPPYHKIRIAEYLPRTFLGSRSGVYQASIGCPHGCNFCAVISVFGRRERQETPERTVKHLSFLAREHGMNGVHFYDNNFLVGEDRAREFAERVIPLGLHWWCEARVDTLTRYSDDTWRLLKRSGMEMVFCGAESGSDAVLAKMNKGTTTDQIREVAARSREHGVIPEFSFIFGGPGNPEGETLETLNFIRELKLINPDMELISQFFTPTPQRKDTYGGVDPLSGTPKTLDEWTTPEWLGWMTHDHPKVAWFGEELRSQILDFDLVLSSRFPSLHDYRTAPWGKALGKMLARGRWGRADYKNPRALRTVRKLAERLPEDNQAYGHLRPPATKTEWVLAESAP